MAAQVHARAASNNSSGIHHVTSGSDSTRVSMFNGSAPESGAPIAGVVVDRDVTKVVVPACDGDGDGGAADGATTTAGAGSTPEPELSRPHALQHLNTTIKQQLEGKRLLVFLDYDGTLTPIVVRPNEAFLPSGTRTTLQQLAGVVPVSIVTGRSLEKIVDFVNLDELYYAGSHGFKIRGPRGTDIGHDVATSMRPDMEAAIEALTARIAHIPGAEVEDNFLAVSVHYRSVDPSQVQDIEHVVDTYLEETEYKLTKHHGKMVYELRPRVEWNKGYAVQWLVAHVTHALGCAAEDVASMYIGDDTSDEDAFAVLSHMPHSVSILVCAGRRDTTHAVYQLRDPGEVNVFLQGITRIAADAPTMRSAPSPRPTAAGVGAPTVTFVKRAPRSDSASTVSADSDRIDPPASNTPPSGGAGAGAGAGAGSGAASAATAAAAQ